MIGSVLALAIVLFVFLVRVLSEAVLVLVTAQRGTAPRWQGSPVAGLPGGRAK